MPYGRGCSSSSSSSSIRSMSRDPCCCPVSSLLPMKWVGCVGCMCVCWPNPDSFKHLVASSCCDYCRANLPTGYIHTILWLKNKWSLHVKDKRCFIVWAYKTLQREVVTGDREQLWCEQGSSLIRANLWAWYCPTYPNTTQRIPTQNKFIVDERK